MAYKYHGGGRQRILHADISFHGKLLGAASVTGSPEQHVPYPRIPGTTAFAYDSIDSVRQLVASPRRADGGSDVYAILVEPVSASSLRACSEPFLRQLRELCDAEEILLIFDEVYTGWGKCGALFSFMRFEGLVPDILAMAKSFGGGKASIAGFVAREPVFRRAYGNLHDATLHSTTYNGFGEECVTAIEAVNIVVEDNYPAKARHIGEVLGQGLIALQRKHPQAIREVRGVGALQGVLLSQGPQIVSSVAKLIPTEFTRDERFLQKLITASVIHALYERHGVLTYYGSNREIPLMLCPSLVITNEELQLAIRALDETLSQGLLPLCLSFLKSKYFSGRP
jgi:putrescine aminotransferase